MGKEIIVIMEFGLVQSVYTNIDGEISFALYNAEDEYTDTVEAMEEDMERIRNDTNFRMIW